MNAPEEATVWYPTADELLLIKVGKSQRPRIRERLRPWLASFKHAVTGTPMGVTPSRCFEVAQALVMTAHDAGVQYIEGVYIDPWWFKRVPEFEPEAHAWVAVDGFCVDLMDELMAKKSGSKRGRLYEQHRVYTHQEVGAFIRDCKPTSSSSIAAWPFMNDPAALAKVGNDRDLLLELVFEPAKQALIKRRDEEIERKHQRKTRAR